MSCNGNTAVNLVTLKVKENMKDRWIITHELKTIICMLVKAGADVNIPNNKNTSQLLHAVFGCNFKFLDTLIANGLADGNQVDNRMGTALLIVASNNNCRSIKSLLKAGAFIDKHDQKHNTVLHHSVKINDPKSVNLLIKAGTNVNADYFHYQSALELANRYGYQKSIEILIVARPNCKKSVNKNQNNDGMLLLD